ncbi:RNA polymerase sigma factor [Thermogemmatispora tikiterensis]|uniref:RNA polymerase sigma factor 70 region 4 type 2 domain-containing protein n=1 Tax=Thermogemmatispora tikiterensis TaxID=1825093 RepID=A0A328VEJ4_9CHLR|nr:sigma-70 family RNA polymerase sigma factor [Thermogemmatispora tikiterensis]RAQ93963.1 hypothetical protein A4R35_00365 [Thermogemmatispora tikiterensis]
MDEQHRESLLISGSNLHTELAQYLQDANNYRLLYGILRQLVARSGLIAAGNDAELQEQTDELFQSVIQRAFELANKQPGHKVNLQGWLLRIAHNILKEFRRQHQQEKRRTLPLKQITSGEYEDDEAFFTLFSQRLTTADPTLELEQREGLREAFSNLSEADRQILSLFLHYGFQHNEIAHLLKISPGATRVRFCRALGRLQAILEAQEKQRRGERHG